MYNPCRMWQIIASGTEKLIASFYIGLKIQKSLQFKFCPHFFRYFVGKFTIYFFNVHLSLNFRSIFFAKNLVHLFNALLGNDDGEINLFFSHAGWRKLNPLTKEKKNEKVAKEEGSHFLFFHLSLLSLSPTNKQTQVELLGFIFILFLLCHFPTTANVSVRLYSL